MEWAIETGTWALNEVDRAIHHGDYRDAELLMGTANRSRNTAIAAGACALIWWLCHAGGKRRVTP